MSKCPNASSSMTDSSATNSLHPPLEGEGRRAAHEVRCETGWGDALRRRKSHPTPPPSAATLPRQGRVNGASGKLRLLALSLGVSLFSLTATGIAAHAQKATPTAHAPTKPLGIGREAKADEIAGWDIDIRPDGVGLPAGTGTVKQGDAIYMQQCAACHGEFGESAGRWPIIAGGAGRLASHDPV